MTEEESEGIAKSLHEMNEQSAKDMLWVIVPWVAITSATAASLANMIFRCLP